ncbi:hypothetical protein Tco_1446502, partial [Tanacetum coccineum]
ACIHDYSNHWINPSKRNATVNIQRVATDEWQNTFETRLKSSFGIFILFDILACSVSRSNSVREGANTNTRKRDWKLATITFRKVKIPSTRKRRRPCVETRSSLENTITHSSVQEVPVKRSRRVSFDTYLKPGTFEWKRNNGL